jgi:hypothetical protein
VKNENIQHPTSNNQHPLPETRTVASLDVRCWLLVVGCSQMKIFKSIQWRQSRAGVSPARADESRRNFNFFMLALTRSLDRRDACPTL